ncbi:MAG: hypothetical protein LBD08_05075 [Treponema sp.]|jgi:hypothetical protein|nr:hypothetical protein [Treponema sp.]
MKTSPELSVSQRPAFRLCLCAGERLKLIGTADGRFPDFGHHLEKEMGGLWLHPVKLLDGFWIRLKDLDSENVDVWTIADSCEVRPEGIIFQYRTNLGHTPIQMSRAQIIPDAEPGISGSGGALLTDCGLFNASASARRVELEFLARTDIRPVWYSERGGIIDREDEGAWLEGEGLFLAKDRGHEWYAAAGSVPPPEKVLTGNIAGPENTAGRGVSVSFTYTLEIAPGETRNLRFIIAGSAFSREDCLAAYRSVQPGRDYWEEKRQRYGELLARSRLCVQDPAFETVYGWVKVNTDWLIFDTGPYGRGIGAGIPEYPWWFGCDSCYALQGALALGDYRLARDTLNLLLEYSEKHNGNGRILHEITTAGIAAHPGNTQETAHFIIMVWLYYQWTGDREFLERAFPALEKSAAWLRARDEDGDLFPGGYGIIEIPGLNSKMLDTAVYAASAYRSFARISALLGNDGGDYSALSESLIRKINESMWDEEAGLYCDTFTSAADVQSRRDAILGRLYGPGAEKGRRMLDAALEKKAGLPPDKKSGWLLNYAWIISTPMEMGIAPPRQAERALERMHGPEFQGPYGAYLSGLYQEEAMTISTGVMAAAQARYGYPDRALELLKRMFSAFNRSASGCIAEMLPDGGCFVQAWTVYAVMVPIAGYFFGIQPNAAENQLIIRPDMPRSWPRASLERVRVLDGELSIQYAQDKDENRYHIVFTGKTPVFFEYREAGKFRRVPAPPGGGEITFRGEHTNN